MARQGAPARRGATARQPRQTRGRSAAAAAASTTTTTNITAASSSSTGTGANSNGTQITTTQTASVLAASMQNGTAQDGIPVQSVQSVQTTVQQPPARPTRNIRGPQSALTDFLASHNISANQIRQAHQQRLNVAQAQEQEVDDDPGEGPSNANASSAGNTGNGGSSRSGSKRKAEQQNAIDKIKASKKFQKRKKHLEGSDEEDDLIEQLLKSRAPQPGQMANCKYQLWLPLFVSV